MSPSSLALSLRNAGQVALTESRSLIKLFRFWFVVVFLSVSVMSAYVLSCLVYVNTAPYNFSSVGGTPLYLLGNLDPAYFVFFAAGLLLLVFDFQHRIRKYRLDEVIESRPVTNLEFQLGRTLCYAGLFWIVVCLNVLFMQFLGLGSQLFKLDIADTIQLHSVFNLLLVDAPVALLFWTSLFLLLTTLLRSRLLTVLTASGAMLVHYLWVLNTPFSFVDLLSHSSNQTLFVSDILPAFPSVTSWIMRLGTSLLAVALIGAGAWVCSRSHQMDQSWTRVLPMTFLGVGVLVLSAGVAYEVRQSNEISEWRLAHLNSEWTSKLDVQTIQGEVQINPHREMHLDLDLSFILTSQTPTQRLVFTLNPGYQITTITVDDTPCDNEFENGILEVSIPFEIRPEREYSLNIVAQGKPNPHFAYLNTPYDYLADEDFPIQAIHSYGTDGSIYNSRFVALMPGVHWYPVPGTVPRPADDDPFGSDFFKVELNVRLDAPSSWKVAGSGTSQTHPTEPKEYLIKPNVPVASIGLFASDFVRMSHDFENVELALYLHSKHSNNFVALERYKDELLAEIDGRLKRLVEDEFPIPYSSLVFVEVPSKLRTIGGGWRMGRVNSLPGVVLLKERGLPNLNIETLVKSVENTETEPEDRSNRVWSRLYSASENALGSEKLDSAIRDQIWNHLVSTSGEHGRALNLIFHIWMGRFTPSPTEGLFSVYATAQASRWTGLSLPAKRLEGLFWKEMDYSGRPAVRNMAERTSLAGLAFHPDFHQQDFEVLFQKSLSIYQSLFWYFNFRRQNTERNRWLVELRRRFTGQRFTYIDVIDVARELDIDIHLFLGDWLSKDSLPGYEVAPGTPTRIANSEDGSPRFLFTFEIANTQETSGFLHTLRDTLPVFTLAGKTSKRLTVVRELSSRDQSGVSFIIDTGLSLNRGPIGFVLPTEGVPVDESLAPVDQIEESDFVPKRDEIIVDDLNSGFVVHQSKPLPFLFRYAPRDWFWVSTFHEDFDGTLTDIDHRFMTLNARWVRRFEMNAHGRFRRTVALSRVTRSLKLHPVRFIADIPVAGQWALDFYVHKPSNQREYGSLANFNFEIENNAKLWNTEVNPDSSEAGWRFVDNFELDAGKTDVILVGATKPSIVYADAIRWRRVAEPE
ncbi:MAG: hypothetical protein F4Z01_04120 [Gammaproteobacteria bacterium]|nr:hypothetical protein [Gammaproteobacteria bacterium]MYF37734.1 hypothetical protein [Gammaproteobacteria bacterium]